MLYRINPKTGDKLSALGFGAMRLPIKDDGRIDEQTASEMIRYAIENGVNYIDTGYDYHKGESESFIGRALKGGLREKVFLATKLPSWHVESKEDMKKILDEQLSRLQTGYIDYYLLIALSKTRWRKLFDLGVTDFLDEAKRKGAIKHAGFSFHGDFNLFRKILDSYDWDICQVQYNYLDEDFQAGTKGLEYARKKGIGVAAMMPLRGGHLAGNIPDDINGMLKKVDSNRSPAEWGYKWVLNRPEISVMLSGMSTPEQAKENVRVASESEPLSMTYKELELVSDVAEILRKKMRINCTNCGYCMPCPEGVDIPACFTHYNSSFLFNDFETANFYYHSMLKPESNGTGAASMCTRCGRCLEMCPQGINIAEMLSEVENYFSDSRQTIPAEARENYVQE
ncbi:putative aldo/keto reductase-like oxidoreductase [Methanomicrobium sp. W14]|uniref:aldo/keto reductase n=1 Tax=Methanomicrobium sp. W14 TaxID=2817839 RepID=UPI001AE71936|nr:aldo/keto reductase [Methanomicrobium sp. W14]MBP2133904.1 putative aldo/keto reductase-like oxidoreductase [Methanomicrobium sp. W14]